MDSHLESRSTFSKRILWLKYISPQTRISNGAISRIRKHSVKSTFHKQFTPTHQKGRLVPINLQPLVNVELKKLLDEKHIKKLNSGSDKNFISSIVITVKRDKSVKLALDSKINV